MQTSHTGGCACSAIRYEIDGPPLFSNHCQCRDCQLESGTGHSSYLTFARKVVRIAGKAASWDMQGDSGHVKTRAFCPICGVAVYLTFSAMPDLFAVRAGTLDDPAQFRPQVVTYASRGYDWDVLDSALRKFDKMPS